MPGGIFISRGRLGKLSYRALITTFFFALSFTHSQAAFDNKGTDFWLAFPTNEKTTSFKILYIISDVTTTGTVEIPGLGFSAPFAVTAGMDTPVTLPVTTNIDVNDGIENKGVHVTALGEIAVVGFDWQDGSGDAFLGLPTDVLGTEYIVMAYTASPRVWTAGGSQFAIVAPEDGTEICITLPIDAGSHFAGVPYTITLDQGEAYQIYRDATSAQDITGTIIISTKPVAVFGGSKCADVPINSGGCDHIIEQLPPTSLWGTNFVTVPLMARINGDFIRMLASQDGTTMTVNGSVVGTFSRGGYIEQSMGVPAHITSDKPILVSVFSRGDSTGSACCPIDSGDPFMMLVPPTNHYTTAHLVRTLEVSPTPFRHYLGIFVPDTSLGLVTLDGVAIPAGSYTSIGTSGFSAYQTQVASGPHTIIGPEDIGVRSYGFKGPSDPAFGTDSYGFPSGSNFGSAPVTTPPTIAASPASETLTVGNTACVTVVWNDVYGNPFDNGQVDFDVTGANTTSGTVITDSSGEAVFCYTGNNPGSDTIAISTCPLTDSVAKDWIASPTPTYTTSSTKTHTGTPTYTPTNTPTPTWTPTWTSTWTSTWTGTVTPTATHTGTISATWTPTPTTSITPTVSDTVTETLSITLTPTLTVTPTFTFTSTPPTEIRIWPIPFNPDTAFGGVLKIETIPDDSTFNIFTVSGELVREIIPIGGRAEWDGRNRNGRTVSSGSYYYLVRVGKETLKAGKIVVVRSR